MWAKPRGRPVNMIYSRRCGILSRSFRPIIRAVTLRVFFFSFSTGILRNARAVDNQTPNCNISQAPHIRTPAASHSSPSATRRVPEHVDERTDGQRFRTDDGQFVAISIGLDASSRTNILIMLSFAPQKFMQNTNVRYIKYVSFFLSNYVSGDPRQQVGFGERLIR